MAKYVTALFNHWVTPTLHITKGEKYDIDDPDLRAVYESHLEWFTTPEAPKPKPAPRPAPKPVEVEEKPTGSDRVAPQRLSRSTRRRVDALKAAEKVDDES